MARYKLVSLLAALRLVWMIAFAFSLAGVPPAQAAEGAPGAEPIGLRYALVWRLKGDVVASSGGRERALREGDLVFVRERLRAGPTGEAVLKTDDAGMIAVRPRTEFVAERFSARGERGDGFVMRLFVGSLRIISGWVGSFGRDSHQVVTPTATIGIRGTDHEPFVLDADVDSADGIYRQGTYDKVNRGGTTLESAGKSVDIDPGKVGFVRASGKQQRTRALMTLLLPVILDRVPGFYVPGAFDAELDAYSPDADAAGQKQLAQKKRGAEVTPHVPPPTADECQPQTVARKWLAQLDTAIVRRDPAAVVALFATDASVRASVRNPEGGRTTLDLSRQEMADSTVAAVSGLTDYRQKRLSLKAGFDPSVPAGNCGEIWVKSAVVEQGKQSGKPYRFESTESYRLQLRDGAWVAVRAETTQR